MEFSDYIIFVDESGDQNLVQTNPAYPIFSLAFCIFRKSDYMETVVPSLQALKFKWFGHNAFVLHEREVRKRGKPFDVLRSKNQHEEFMAELSRLMTGVPVMVIASVINKEKLKTQYAAPMNPYELALRFCVERTAYFLHETKQENRLTHMIVECRGPREDRDLELEFRRILDEQGGRGETTCLDILFVDKKSNSTGLQIADLFARPIGLKVLRPDQANRAYDIIETKFRRDRFGNIKGYGLKVFP